MTLSFSQRYGYKKIKETFQVEYMDDDLKNGIWNVMLNTCFNEGFNTANPSVRNDTHFLKLSRNIWANYLKQRLNRMPFYSDIFKEYIESFIFEDAEWYEIYDLIEFISKNIDAEIYSIFKYGINLILEREMSGYRLVNEEITPIIDTEEIEAIETAINHDELKHVSIHIETALDLMSDRYNPNYRNSIKESISAVEGVAKLLTSDKKAELKPALNALDDKLKPPLHGALKEGFLKIYGYTSDGDGIRHALTESDNVSFEDAKFMLVTCSAFVNYLISKAMLAGIEIK